MSNNTTNQEIYRKQNVIISGGVVVAPAATMEQHIETIGTFVLTGVTPVTVTEPNYKNRAQSILISLNTVGGTVGAIPAVQTVTPGTGFTVAGTASDTSIYTYRIV